MLQEHQKHHEARQNSGTQPEPDAIASHMEIKQSAMALMETIRYASHFGTPAQVKELKQIIEETSRQIHGILARNDSDPR